LRANRQSEYIPTEQSSAKLKPLSKKWEPFKDIDDAISGHPTNVHPAQVFMGNVTEIIEPKEGTTLRDENKRVIAQ
jgi:hypothetical protein